MKTGDGTHQEDTTKGSRTKIEGPLIVGFFDCRKSTREGVEGKEK